jgi:hypothetical protein
MTTPKTMSAKEKAVWKKLFTNFAPLHAVEVEMAKRYCVWFLVAEAEQKRLMKGETTDFNDKQGNTAQSSHFKNAKDAETEMRRLWQQLEKRMTKVKESKSEFDEL